jgi:UDP-2,4-diacetamido-2,4,6-trideoxy-beta-L-altropyranose hydrolase
VNEGPQVLFRADASSEIGTGHVVRCQALAGELQRRGWGATLISRELPPGLLRLLRASGIQTLRLPPASRTDEEPGIIAAALPRPAALLVIDHYGIGAEWQAAASDRAERLMAIDDLADRSHSVDLLLNQNLGASETLYRGLVPPGAEVLCGPDFALIRPEFAAARSRARDRSGRIDRILVFMSGADQDDVTRRAASAAMTLGVPVDVVVGPAYPFEPELRAWVDGQPLVDLHVNTSGMVGLMERADLAIGAPGSASWERCTLGLPTVLVTLADNQAEAARRLAEAGAGLDLGWHTAVAAHDLEMALIDLRANPHRVRAMAEAAARITDGRGIIRVADHLEQLVSRPRPSSPASRSGGDPWPR